MPRKMDYYEKITTFDNNNLNKKKAMMIYKKICKEDGYLRIPATPNGISAPLFNNYYESLFIDSIKNKLANKNYKKTVLNKSKIIIKKLIKSLCVQKTEIINKSSILSGALSFGFNLFFIFGILAAAERGYNGAIGGEVFIAITGIYIMYKFLNFANKKDRSKT